MTQENEQRIIQLLEQILIELKRDKPLKPMGQSKSLQR